MESEIDMRRRLLIVSAVGTLATSMPTRPSAQYIPIPSIELTEEYVQTSSGIALLYTRFSLAYALGINIVALEEGATPNSTEGLPLFPSESSGSGELFIFLTELAEIEGLRADFVGLLATNGDPLGEAHFALINGFVAGLGKVGLSIESEVIAAAVDSLSHVERLANLRFSSAGSAYLCRVFPFSWWCG